MKTPKNKKTAAPDREITLSFGEELIELVDWYDTGKRSSNIIVDGEDVGEITRLRFGAKWKISELRETVPAPNMEADAIAMNIFTSSQAKTEKLSDLRWDSLSDAQRAVTQAFAHLTPLPKELTDIFKATGIYYAGEAAAQRGEKS